MKRNLRCENLARWLCRNIDEPGLSKSQRHNIKYYRQLAMATPSWQNIKRIKSWYRLAQQTGNHVDHIVPLNHPYVCGLHCEANFQLLKPSHNIAKGNYNWPDSPFEAYHMFNNPMETEQYLLNF